MTLAELVIAMGIAFALGAAIMLTYLWAVRTSVQTAKVVVSQNRAMTTGEIIGQYVRNANRIIEMDEENGTWVRLGFSDGSSGLLVYSNAIPDLRDGRLYLIRTNNVTRLVTRGMTGFQTTVGFSPNVFFSPRPDLLRIRYRVTDPVTSEGREVVNDGVFASSVDLTIHLRNTTRQTP